MTDVTIKPTGVLRIAGWLLIVAGALCVLVVAPLWTLGGALDKTSTGWIIRLIGSAAPWVGLVAAVAGVVALVIASKRAAANREAAQRATLARV